MAKYRNDLPQMSGGLFIKNGGLETTLIFKEGFDLPEFATFDLVNDNEGRKSISRNLQSFAAVARNHSVGIIMEAPTWRASRDWAAKLGYTAETLADAIHKSVELVGEIRNEFENANTPIVISGAMGPRADGYDPEEFMTAEQAHEYHSTQIGTFVDTDVDLVTAFTMTYVDEAVGIVKAAQSAKMPVAISFTLETDGCLPTGPSLVDAIEKVDAASGGGPDYYMINCAHPTHFAETLASGDRQLKRLRGLVPNASSKSHQELSEATELDEGNPAELAEQMREIRKGMPWVNILAGCCGTDSRLARAHCEASGPDFQK
jgi:S-methylmethionine-dependent homocysteine/selenocysteine methylase